MRAANAQYRRRLRRIFPRRLALRAVRLFRRSLRPAARRQSRLVVRRFASPSRCSTAASPARRSRRRARPIKSDVATYRQTVLTAIQQVERPAVLRSASCRGRRSVQAEAVRASRQATQIALNEYQRRHPEFHHRRHCRGSAAVGRGGRVDHARPVPDRRGQSHCRAGRRLEPVEAAGCFGASVVARFAMSALAAVGGVNRRKHGSILLIIPMPTEPNFRGDAKRGRKLLKSLGAAAKLALRRRQCRISRDRREKAGRGQDRADFAPRSGGTGRDRAILTAAPFGPGAVVEALDAPPASSAASARIAAVTPEPQVVMTGFARSTLVRGEDRLQRLGRISAGRARRSRRTAG